MEGEPAQDTAKKMASGSGIKDIRPLEEREPDEFDRERSGGDISVPFYESGVHRKLAYL